MDLSSIHLTYIRVLFSNIEKEDAQAVSYRVQDI